MANPCECATGLCPDGSSLTGPVGTENPPGGTRLRYRLGVHGTFKEAMRLAAAESPGLARHTSRDDSSAAVAFMDAAAVLLDILTFYNERHINEGFLPTATERLSSARNGAQHWLRIEARRRGLHPPRFRCSDLTGNARDRANRARCANSVDSAAGRAAADFRDHRIRGGATGMELV